jgi:hypothetical protein
VVASPPSEATCSEIEARLLESDSSRDSSASSAWRRCACAAFSSPKRASASSRAAVTSSSIAATASRAASISARFVVSRSTPERTSLRSVFTRSTTSSS